MRLARYKNLSVTRRSEGDAQGLESEKAHIFSSAWPYAGFSTRRCVRRTLLLDLVSKKIDSAK